MAISCQINFTGKLEEDYGAAVFFITKNAHILVRNDIITPSHNIPTPVVFKNCAPLIKCITKIDGTTKDDAEEKYETTVQKQ